MLAAMMISEFGDAAAAFVGMVRKEARQGAVIDALLGELTAFSRETGHA